MQDEDADKVVNAKEDDEEDVGNVLDTGDMLDVRCKMKVEGDVGDMLDAGDMMDARYKMKIRMKK